MMKQYKLLGADGSIYLSDTPGEYGGNSKQRVYGRMNCGTKLASMRRFPSKYEQSRVFFADEKTALAAGYRPCGNCLRQKYKEYMADPEAYKAKFDL
ncbi:MAG: Ada metal-binding domain-containing protein [Eubacteriales bacterium]|nr:Ada metal-binding domain-containing protein [Eubacteriales bacterium]